MPIDITLFTPEDMADHDTKVRDQLLGIQRDLQADSTRIKDRLDRLEVAMRSMLAGATVEVDRDQLNLVEN